MNKMLSISMLFFVSCLFPGEKGEWTVMTWNVQNLFDEVDNGNEYTEFDPGKGIWNERLLQRRLDRVAEVVVKTVPGGADLIVFQELENQNVLDRLLKESLKGRGYDYSLTIPGFSIIRCGVISRYPLSNVSAVDCGQWGSRSLRPALGFSVDIPGSSAYVIALHWKSPRGNRSATEEPRRLEAAIVRDMVKQKLDTDQDAKIIVIGDLNTPGDGLVLPAALGPYGTLVDEAVIWRTDVPEFPPYDSQELVLYDPEPTAGPPGTYNYLGQWDRPDRALLSRGFTEGPGLVFHISRIGTLDVMLNSQGYPERWRTDLEEGYSDHLPLILEFNSTLEFREDYESE